MNTRLIALALLSAVGLDVQAEGFYADLGFAGQQYSLGYTQPVGSTWRLRGEYSPELSLTAPGIDTGNSVNLANHFYRMNLKYPTASTYLGVGYGHQTADKGLGFFANLGLTLGSFRADVNTDLLGMNHNGSTFTQADMDAQKLRTNESLLGLKYQPSVSMGLVYRY
jgi:hypothetical protein